MDNRSERMSSRLSNISSGTSPTVSEKRQRRDSRIQHISSNLEQKLQTLRTFALNSLWNEEYDQNPQPQVVQPLKPMPYIRHFTVPISLKKSRVLSHRNSNATQWAIGKRQFNENPKEGYRWLVENNLLENTSEHMAAFLFNDTGLSKRAIGEFLGEKDDFHIEVLKKYADLHDFFSKDIVEALRVYLFKFLLPGEAQKIDRIMEAFARRYYQCNPDIFPNADVCYILAFAITMLNTSLHNKSARIGGTFTNEKFYENLSKTIEKEQMPDASIIKNIYDSIRNNELKFPEEDINLSNIGARIRDGNSNIILEGWLWKQGSRVRSWKRRWFILTDGCLCYYESRTDIDNLRGMIPLIDIGIRETDEDRTKPFCFEIFPLAREKIKSSKPIPNEAGKMSDGYHSLFRLAATNEDEEKEWIRALRFASQNELPKQRFS